MLIGDEAKFPVLFANLPEHVLRITRQDEFGRIVFSETLTYDLYDCFERCLNDTYHRQRAARRAIPR